MRFFFQLFMESPMPLHILEDSFYPQDDIL